MNRRLGAALLVSACVATGVFVAARGTGVLLPQDVPAGSAVLTGIVVTDEEPSRPVRRATVRLTRDGMSPRLTGTNDEGRFVFDGLPAGSYAVSATKAGYVTAHHGSTRPGRGPGIPVAVTEGGRSDIALVLLQGGVITGTVTSPEGVPVQGVQVLGVDVRPHLSAGPAPGRATTDDRGVFRIYGLAPGDYVVVAIPRLTPAARGRTSTEVVNVTTAEVQWALAAAGPGTLAPVPAGGAAAAPPGRIVSYSPVFHPGTTDAAAAALVSVAAGEERVGIDLSLRIVTMARVSGTLVDPTGQSVDSASVSLYPRHGERPSVVDALVTSGVLTLPRAFVTTEGFTISGVAPGDYRVVARTGSGQRRTRAQDGASPAAAALWSVTDLIVDGNDRTDLVLPLATGLALTGSIAFESDTLAPPADLSATDLSLVATRPLPGMPSTSTAVVNLDGTFRFSSVAPGTYLLRATLPPAAAGQQWVLKSAMASGRDLTDLPLDASGGGRLDGLVVTFADHAAGVSGRLIDAADRAVTRYTIVLCTPDRSFWAPGARRNRSTRPATDGTFSIRNLPAGRYAIAAVEEFEDAFLADPQFLERLLASGFIFTLADGEQKRQDLRVGGGR